MPISPGWRGTKVAVAVEVESGTSLGSGGVELGPGIRISPVPGSSRNSAAGGANQISHAIAARKDSAKTEIAPNIIPGVR